MPPSLARPIPRDSRAPRLLRGSLQLGVDSYGVYSYGVVLLETVTCRRSMELEEAGEERTLMERASARVAAHNSCHGWMDGQCHARTC